MELHSLDGKLSALNISSKYDPDRRNELLETLEGVKLTIEARNILNILIANIGHPANVDGINNLVVDDLLWELGSHIRALGDNFDSQLLDEKLIEMKTGMCPQGRTIRLYEVIYATMTLYNS